MIEQIQEFFLDFGLYCLWLFTFALTLTSSVILAHHYSKSKGTPIGRTSLYFFFNSFWWSVTSALITIPFITTIPFAEGYFILIFPFMAGIASILGAYERSKIQILLMPNEKKQILNKNLWLIASSSILSIALFSLVATMLDNPLQNILATGIGGLTCLGFALAGGLLVALPFNRVQKVVYLGSLGLILLGMIVITGQALGVLVLRAPLPGAPTKVTTAVVFVAIGIWMGIAKCSGLRLWIVRMVMAMSVLSTIVLAIVTHFSYHTQDLTTVSTLLIVMVSGILLWRSWKTQRT